MTNDNSRKIIIVITSANNLNGHDTGFWVEEVASPYYMFRNQGYAVQLASPKGGPCPIDSMSMSKPYMTDRTKDFLLDDKAMGALSHTLKVGDVDWDTVDCIYLAGGHGACVDFINNPELKNAIETVYKRNKVVAADCHGVIALADCMDGDSPLVKGKSMTGFTDSEERAVHLTDKVPFLLQSKLSSQGADFQVGDDWTVKVVRHDNLVTGQNPQSSTKCAASVIDSLSK